MRKQEAAAAVFRRDKPRDEPPCYTRFYALHMGNCPYQLSGKRHAPSFLQGTRPRFASGTLMSLRAIPLSSYRGSWRLGALCPSSAPAGHPDVASGGDSYAWVAMPRTRLDSREAHPVLARQLRIRLHKALRSRTRGAENAHTLITHRLKQAQQLRGHVGCRQQRPLRVA